MLRHRRPRFVAENLSVAAFGDIRVEALNAPGSSSSAPASPPPAATAVAEAPLANAAEAPPAAAAEVGPAAAPYAAIVIDDSPLASTQRVESRQRSAEVAEDR